MKVQAQKQNKSPGEEPTRRGGHLAKPVRDQIGSFSKPSGADKTDAGACMSPPSRFAHDFSRIPVTSGSSIVQTKLTANAPGDEHEQEADRIASQILGGCARGGASQTKRIRPNQPEETSIPAEVREVTRSAGQPLDTTMRELMESRFGHDFSQVSIHTDERAAASANAVRARAYTVGQHIAFGAGEYRPHTTEGRRLLAHELTHTLQQRPAEADVHTRPHGVPLSLQRQAAPDEDPVPGRSGSPRALRLLEMFLKDKPAYQQLDEGAFLRESKDRAANFVESAQVQEGAVRWEFTFVTNSKAGVIYIRQKPPGGPPKYYLGALPTGFGEVAHSSDSKPCPDLALPVVTDTTRWRVTEVPAALKGVPAVPYAPVAAFIPNTTHGISAITKRGSDRSGALGEYVYEYTFCLCEGFSNPVLDLTFATDNDSKILLNGYLIGATPPDLTPGTLLTGAAEAGFFVAGQNTLTYRIQNRGIGTDAKVDSDTGLGVNGTLTAKNGQCY